MLVLAHLGHPLEALLYLLPLAIVGLVLWRAGKGGEIDDDELDEWNDDPAAPHPSEGHR